MGSSGTRDQTGVPALQSGLLTTGPGKPQTVVVLMKGSKSRNGEEKSEMKVDGNMLRATG